MPGATQHSITKDQEKAELDRAELTMMLRATEAALSGLGSTSAATCPQWRNFAQTLPEKKQWCLQ